jgi:hypothetical protein
MFYKAQEESLLIGAVHCALTSRTQHFLMSQQDMPPLPPFNFFPFRRKLRNHHSVFAAAIFSLVEHVKIMVCR